MKEPGIGIKKQIPKRLDKSRSVTGVLEKLESEVESLMFMPYGTGIFNEGKRKVWT